MLSVAVSLSRLDSKKTLLQLMIVSFKTELLHNDIHSFLTFRRILLSSNCQTGQIPRRSGII